MKVEKDILQTFGFKSYVVDISDSDLSLSKIKLRFIQKEILEKEIKIDKVYFSGDYASVYFKTITDFNPDVLKEICILQKKIWNQRKVPFLYVSTPSELYIYNCFEQPFDYQNNPEIIEQNIKRIEIAKYSTDDTVEYLRNLLAIFSREAIDSGELWKDNEKAKKFNINSRVDKVLVRNLNEAKDALYDLSVDPPEIHDLLTRSLFVLFLEDIGATNKEFYGQFKINSETYYDLLTDKKATYKFFQILETKFNGNVFPVSKKEETTITDKHLEIVKFCFWGDELRTGQQVLWKKFDFSVIPIELLSEIYEIFLKKTELEKSNSGEYYTPHSLVDLILNESLPWADDKNTQYDLKILDVACGSGIFLVESYRRLIDRWIYTNKKEPGFNVLRQILLNSIFAFEINPEAIKVAAFSLYLALISYLEPKTLWIKNEIQFPYLIYDPELENNQIQGKNLCRQSSLSNTIPNQEKFDLIVGNPPFKSAKTGSLNKEASYYCKKYGFAQELVLPFLHRASQLCNEKGRISIISTSKILFNKSGGFRSFRSFLFKENYVDTVINFSALRKPKKGQGKSIFVNAVGPACVLFFSKKEPEKPKDRITYVCPKPSVRDRFVDALILDKLDFYYLPRNECEKPDTVIWKTAMWGTERDFFLIQKFSESKPLKYYLTEENGWYKGNGIQFLTNGKDDPIDDNEIKNFYFIDNENLSNYYTPKSNLRQIFEVLTPKANKFYLNFYKGELINQLEINHFRRIPNKLFFYAPHILIKKGQAQKRFSATFIDYKCAFKDGIYGISIKKDEFIKKSIMSIPIDIIQKALTAYLNSRFVTYLLFLTNSSWGIEREQFMLKEIFNLPALPFEMPEKRVNELALKVDEISKLLSKGPKDYTRISKIENEIDDIIYNALELTDRERYQIEDVLNYSLDLFQEGEKSIAYSFVSVQNLEEYLEILCEDINETLQFSDTSAWTSIFEMPDAIPLRMISVHFTGEYNAGSIQKISSESEINKLINNIDKFTYEKHSESIYFRKVMKYYKDDIIYILKPNQKRFWSRSLAMQDAEEIRIDISNM